MIDLDKIKKQISTKAGTVIVYHLPRLEALGFGGVQRLPYSIKVLLESAVRNMDGFSVMLQDVRRIAAWNPKTNSGDDIAFKPGRVILQDFTGVPALVDLAAMRDSIKRLGGDFRKINPQVICDLVVDHSVQVDAFGTADSLGYNVGREFERNRERYEFLKWGQRAFQNFKVVPPATGIVHQVNLEYLAQGVLLKKQGNELVAYPDSVVGTDSHTTMINGLGVVGWGVGGIEAEAVMLGEPICMVLPEVVGFRLRGRTREGVTATDLVLTVTEILRKKGVVGKFVEFFGEGLARMSLADRATVANMAPEYGATMGYFPVDEETLRYYRITGRSDAQTELIEHYYREQGMFYETGLPDPLFTDVVELDLATVEPSMAGPKRPQDRVGLGGLKKGFLSALQLPKEKRGFGLSREESEKSGSSVATATEADVAHGSVVIAAITSCTNTSNPAVMISAGLLAKKAVEKGLGVKPYVKTSLAPGSGVVTQYLRNSGLEPYLEKLGFYTVGFGCTTCIGNSGPLPEPVAQAVKDGNLVVASVLSGNRNFEGRVHPLVKANYLASPPLVVAFAIAGRVDIDLTSEPIGTDARGENIYLKDIWPADAEVRDVMTKCVTAKVFRERYEKVFSGNKDWDAIRVDASDLYPWNPASSYIQEPPFLSSVKRAPEPVKPVKAARVLAMFGDSITTDHISPAGDIDAGSPAGRYLIEQGVRPEDFNSYGARRGNYQVMVRGTFANVRLRNLLARDKEGSWSVYWPEGKLTTIYDAAMQYQKDGTPLLVLAGKEYGSGSSRDWAAKGTALLGIRAVIAQSYERIHRSNLVGMGVLPLEFMPGASREELGLTGDEYYDVQTIGADWKPAMELLVTATRGGSGKQTQFKTLCRIDTPVEWDYYQNGGILPAVLRKLAK